VKRAYYGPRWPAISRAIKERDWYRCQVHGCRYDDPGLITHHVIPVEAFNGDLESAHDPRNLATVCSPHHVRIHRGLDMML